MKSVQKQNTTISDTTNSPLNNGMVQMFKVPIAKSKVKPKILTEEKYIEELSKIIQRDFFPDLDKLRAQNDYLDAESRKDFASMAAIRSKFSGSERNERGRSMTPATFETPASAMGNQTPLGAGSSDTPKSNISATSSSATSAYSKNSLGAQHTLDSFLQRYTSEDNYNFQEIIETAEQKLRQRFAVLYNEEQLSAEKMARALTLPDIEQQFEQPDPMREIATWTYKNMNSIMYTPDAVELTEAERLKEAVCKQTIQYIATRLHNQPIKPSAADNAERRASESNEKLLSTETSDNQQQQPKINGFELLKTPSPRPGEAFSPLMTWGHIEGTPFRLDGGDTPLRKHAGPSFKINSNSRRENIGLALAEKVGKKMREQKQHAMNTARKNIGSPFIRSNMDRLASMSPAARRLASGSKFGMRNTPLMMTPSPLPGIRHKQQTPGIVKINSLKRSAATTSAIKSVNRNKRHHKSATGSEDKSCDDSGTTLTDDLLRIPAKRQRATDFF